MKQKKLEDVHSATRQVTTVVNVQLWSSDKALKLFQKASGLDRSGLGWFSQLTWLEQSELQVLDAIALIFSNRLHLD